MSVFQHVPMLIKLPRGVQQTCLNQPWCWLTSVTARFVASWFPIVSERLGRTALHKPRAKHELYGMCPCLIYMTFWKASVVQYTCSCHASGDDICKPLVDRVCRCWSPICHIPRVQSGSIGRTASFEMF